MSQPVRIAEKLTSLEDVRASKATTVWYSARTCWWTTDPRHLEDVRAMRGDSVESIPTDPSGSPLLTTDDVDGFLKAALAQPEHYGHHGIDAFMLAYHGNVVSPTGQPRCAAGWESYNALLDEAGANP